MTRHKPIEKWDRFGLLTVVAQAPRKVTPGNRATRWWVVCDCGDIKAVNDGNLKMGLTRSCGAPEHRRSSLTLTYREAHKRLGRAADHPCHCGAPAEEWAYDHADPDELAEPAPIKPDGHSFGGFGLLAYSVKPSHYRPMCRSCHRRFDTTWGNQ